MVPTLDPAVSSLWAFCDEQIRTAGPHATQPYQLVRDLIRDLQTDRAELEATLTVWAADYHRRASDLCTKHLNDLADVLEQSATVFERLLARLTCTSLTPSKNPQDHEADNAAEILTAISWLWQELEARFGVEVAEDLHAEYNRQGARYAQARAKLRLAGRYARHRRFLLDEEGKAGY